MRHSSPHLIHLQYRPDIDGLRAIAILAVVVFHAFPGALPGGFSGVDIFFVISGFLISKIIFSSLEHDRFSLGEFYVRRVLRIVPALILVLIVAMTAGWLFLFAGEYRKLGMSTVASVGFFQNFNLWSESGYFDEAATSKPLLHLWSLAVEEQFYLFWPVLLALIWRYRVSFLGLTLTVAAASFGANIYLVHTDVTAAFYLPFSRFWELMVGGLLAYLSLHRPQLVARRQDMQAAMGLLLILFGIGMLDRALDFPGWWALIPTAGAFLLISAGPEAWINRRILANKLLVGIGLISYPLYLWHWLLLSFSRILFPEITAAGIGGVLLLSTALAWASYAFIEKAFRRGTHRMAKVFTLVAVMLIVGVGGALCWSYGGFPWRAHGNKADLPASSIVTEGEKPSDKSCVQLNHETKTREEVCLSNSRDPRVLFVGDSHAIGLYSAVYAKRFALKSMVVAGHSCPTYADLDYIPSYEHKWGNNCTAIARHAIAVAARNPSIKVVVLANIYTYLGSKKPQYFKKGLALAPEEAFLEGDGYFIQRMLSLGKKVVLVEDAPTLRFMPEACRRRWPYAKAETCEMTRAQHDAERKAYERALAVLQERYPAVTVFRTTPIFCNKRNCMAHFRGSWLYLDTNHISEAGSLLLLKKMQDAGMFRTAAPKKRGRFGARS